MVGIYVVGASPSIVRTGGLPSPPFCHDSSCLAWKLIVLRRCGAIIPGFVQQYHGPTRPTVVDNAQCEGNLSGFDYWGGILRVAPQRARL